MSDQRQGKRVGKLRQCLGIGVVTLYAVSCPIIAAQEPGPEVTQKLYALLYLVVVASASVLAMCSVAYVTRRLSQQVPIPRNTVIVRLVIAFFSTRGTWYGYVLRVGVIWYGGFLWLKWYWFDYHHGMPLSVDDVLRMLRWNIGCGTLAGLFFYGAMGGANERRRSAIGEPVRATPATPNKRWPMWIKEWLSSCVVLAAVMALEHNSGRISKEVDHDVAFYVAMAMAFLLVSLVTLVYFRTNSRNPSPP